MNDVKILEVDEGYCDCEYGTGLVKYQIGNDFVSFIFTHLDIKNASENDFYFEIIEHVDKNGGMSSFPLWSDLSDDLLYIIEESGFDMKFVEEDDEDWNEEKAEMVLNESAKWKSLNYTVENGAGEEAYITVFAGAMCCVNWYGKEGY